MSKRKIMTVSQLKEILSRFPEDMVIVREISYSGYEDICSIDEEEIVSHYGDDIGEKLQVLVIR